MSKHKSLLYITIVLITLSLITGCNKRRDTIDLSSNSTSQEDDMKDIPPQTPEQEAIDTAEAHFDYVISHQERIAVSVQELKDTAAFNKDEFDNYLMNGEIKQKIKELYKLSKEYEAYHNKVKHTEEADRYYKLAMKSFEDFVKEIEFDLTNNVYDSEDSGINPLMDMMELTLKTYGAFDDIKVSSDSSK